MYQGLSLHRALLDEVDLAILQHRLPFPTRTAFIRYSILRQLEDVKKGILTKEKLLELIKEAK